MVRVNGVIGFLSEFGVGWTMLPGKPSTYHYPYNTLTLLCEFVRRDITRHEFDVFLVNVLLYHYVMCCRWC